MSTPTPERLSGMFDRVLAAHGDRPRVDLAEKLGVDGSYITKLTRGWRPVRLREELLKRLEALDPESPVNATQAPEFYDGVLFAAQAMSQTVTDLLTQARAGLRPGTPSVAAAEAAAKIVRQLHRDRPPTSSKPAARRPKHA